MTRNLDFRAVNNYPYSMNQELTVRKSNAIIGAAYRITKLELMILLNIIAQGNARGGLSADEEYELSVSTLQDQLESGNAYQNLSAAVDRLLRRIVVIEFEAASTKVKRTEILKTHWISYGKYYPKQGRIMVQIEKAVLPYFNELEGYYSQYSLKYVAPMKSTYGIRLYELLLSWLFEGAYKEVEIEWLRNRFELKKSEYPRIYDFKKWVIDPAIKDINDYSNLWISDQYGQRKRGHTITHLQFTFGKKDDNAKVDKIEKTINKKLEGTKIHGVLMSRISEEARPGETCEQVAHRIKETEKAKQRELNL